MMRVFEFSCEERAGTRHSGLVGHLNPHSGPYATEDLRQGEVAHAYLRADADLATFKTYELLAASVMHGIRFRTFLCRINRHRPVTTIKEDRRHGNDDTTHWC